MEQGFGPELIHVFKFGSMEIPLTQTVTTTWFLMAVIVLFAYIGAKNLQKIPSGKQTITEIVVEGIYGLTKTTMGESWMFFAPYVGTIIIYIALANISGLFGLRPPTGDLNTTFALSLTTFAMIHGFAIKNKGVGSFLKGFLEPMPFLLPLNIVGELANPVSLSFRLFGNVVGGLIIMTLVYSALAGASAGLAASIPALGFLNSVPIFQFFIPIALHGYFDVFAGVLQSFIFTMLTMVLISIAAD